MLEKSFAEHFAAEWISAWNSRDLERILSHYSDDFEMSSPVITQITGEPSGKLRGKKAVGTYWGRALELMPTLRFELSEVLVGADSVTLCYIGPRGKSAEVFFFDDDGLVYKAAAHYQIK
ncbi:MAG: nuclear transport factor 2 family protein [Pseudomonadota bacterium]